tara:strand:+ start:216 stop:755 length:540 start_codon:yes stop_codon:yes gene_type:complete
VGLQNGKKIAAIARQSRVIGYTIQGLSEADIAAIEEVSQMTIWKDKRKWISSVKREDKESVEVVYNTQLIRYEDFYKRWWKVFETAMDEGDYVLAERAHVQCLRNMSAINDISGIIPEKPLIKFEQNNFNVEGGVTLTDLVKEANRDALVIEGVVLDGDDDGGGGTDPEGEGRPEVLLA